MKKDVAILGSTGSIGENTIKIFRKDKKNFNIVLLSTNRNISKIFKQAKEFKVKNLIINDYKKFSEAIIKNKNKGINIYNNFKDIDKIFKKKVFIIQCLLFQDLLGLSLLYYSVNTQKILQL